MPIINTEITENVNITENGTYDVAKYTNAHVNVQPRYCLQYINDNGTLRSPTSIFSFDGITTISEKGLMYAFYYKELANGQGDIDLSSITSFEYNEYGNTSAMNGAFYGCQGLKSVNLCNLNTTRGLNSTFLYSSVESINLHSLTTINGSYACYRMADTCNSLTTVDLSSLTSITGEYTCDGMFQYSRQLSQISLSNLQSINGSSACQSMLAATGISSMSFDSLNYISSNNGNSALNNMFYNCYNLTSLSFPALTSNSFGNTNVFDGMCRQTHNVTVHFPSNIESVISSWSSVINGFAGTNTTILYDLPSTKPLIGVDTNTYDRNPKYDTTSVLAWRIGDDWSTLYYTLGTIDPQIGDTIYSDAACTTAVTTIDSIA